MSAPLVIDARAINRLCKDHTRHAGGAGDDCIRCKLVEALPPWARRRGVRP